MSAYRDLVRAAESLTHTTENGKVRASDLDRLEKAVEAAISDRAKTANARDFDVEWRLRRELDASEVAHAMTMGDRDNMYRENRRLLEIIDDTMRELRLVSVPLWNSGHIRRARHQLLDAVPMTKKQRADAMRGRGEEVA